MAASGMHFAIGVAIAIAIAMADRGLHAWGWRGLIGLDEARSFRHA
jgi:hypothetical protein